VLDRGVDEFLNLGKGDNLVKFGVDFVPTHAQDGAVQVDVFPARQFGVKAGPDFEQRADAAVDVGYAFCRLGDARQDLEKCALAGSIAANNAYHFALLDLERDLPEGPDRVLVRGRLWGLATQNAAHPFKRGFDRICDGVAQGPVLFDDPANVVLFS